MSAVVTAPVRRSKPATVTRETFRTSRALDFFTEKELISQTGHGVGEWPLVFLKEATDNALDACEENDIAPVINVTAEAEGISVYDNGPGIPESTIDGVLDYTIRVSSRDAYVAPDRGKQGNALKTLVGMPYVVDPHDGVLVVITNGVKHGIRCRVDPVTQQVVVERERIPKPHRKTGAVLRIEWEPSYGDDDEVQWPFDFVEPQAEGRNSLKEAARRLLTGYALFNPHLTITCQWFDETLVDFAATATDWKKWRPNQPTNALWYEGRHLERLIGACLVHDRQHDRRRTVAEFLQQFDGFTGSAKRKQVIEETGLARVYLDEITVGGQFDTDVVSRLLATMQGHSREVTPARLGFIGADHFAAHFQELGCEPDSIQYAKIARVDDGLPFTLEAAFGWLGQRGDNHRQLFTGVNWSAAIKNPFRAFGRYGGGVEGLLAELYAGSREPVVFALHLAHPRVEYTDKGKSAIAIEGDEEDA